MAMSAHHWTRYLQAITRMRLLENLGTNKLTTRLYETRG
jgi:hypothetical protein